MKNIIFAEDTIYYRNNLYGLGAMIGKGKRSPEVVDAIVRNHSVYFTAVAGAGALL
jgi:tartrate dehydratase beta subunit/fumarate hydratase class I family protein